MDSLSPINVTTTDAAVLPDALANVIPGAFHTPFEAFFANSNLKTDLEAPVGLSIVEAKSGDIAPVSESTDSAPINVAAIAAAITAAISISRAQERVSEVAQHPDVFSVPTLIEAPVEAPAADEDDALYAALLPLITGAGPTPLPSPPSINAQESESPDAPSDLSVIAGQTQTYAEPMAPTPSLASLTPDVAPALPFSAPQETFIAPIQPNIVVETQQQPDVRHATSEIGATQYDAPKTAELAEAHSRQQPPPPHNQQETTLRPVALSEPDDTLAAEATSAPRILTTTDIDDADALPKDSLAASFAYIANQATDAKQNIPQVLPVPASLDAGAPQSNAENNQHVVGENEPDAFSSAPPPKQERGIETQEDLEPTKYISAPPPLDPSTIPGASLSAPLAAQREPLPKNENEAPVARASIPADALITAAHIAFEPSKNPTSQSITVKTPALNAKQTLQTQIPKNEPLAEPPNRSTSDLGGNNKFMEPADQPYETKPQSPNKSFEHALSRETNGRPASTVQNAFLLDNMVVQAAPKSAVETPNDPAQARLLTSPLPIDADRRSPQREPRLKSPLPSRPLDTALVEITQVKDASTRETTGDARKTAEPFAAHITHLSEPETVEAQAISEAETQKPQTENTKTDKPGISSERDAKQRQITDDLRTRAIERQVIAAARDGAEQIRMQLYPPGLGQVLVRVVMEGGKLKLQARTSSAEAADALRDIGGALGDALEQSGFMLMSFDVSHEDTSNGRQASTSSHQPRMEKNESDFSIDVHV